MLKFSAYSVSYGYLSRANVIVFATIRNVVKPRKNDDCTNSLTKSLICWKHGIYVKEVYDNIKSGLSERGVVITISIIGSNFSVYPIKIIF